MQIFIFRAGDHRRHSGTCARRSRDCSCPDPNHHRARRHNNRRNPWNHDAGHASRYHRAVSIRFHALLFLLAADNTGHARLSIHPTDLSDESRYIDDHTLGLAHQHEPGMLVRSAGGYDDRRNSDRRRLPITDCWRGAVLEEGRFRLIFCLWRRSALKPQTRIRLSGKNCDCSLFTV